MKNRFQKPAKIVLAALLICFLFTGFLYWNSDIGVPKSRLESDIRSSQKMETDWIVDGTVSGTIAAFISYPRDMTDHTVSVYVNRPGLSFGYFFRGGGGFIEVKKGIAEFTVEGYQERAFVSMNQQQVKRLEIKDGDTMQAVDLDSGKPFALVLPINAGDVTFYDAGGNTVEIWKHPL